MIIDETQTIPAIDIMLHTNEIASFRNEYIIVLLPALQATRGHLLDVITILSGSEWEIVSVASEQGVSFALFRNTHFKRKNKAKEKAKRSHRMILDETQAMRAADIMSHSEEIPMLTNQWIVISDQAISTSFKNMIYAINLLGDFGWETFSISCERTVMFALARNVDKNHQESISNT